MMVMLVGYSSDAQQIKKVKSKSKKVKIVTGATTVIDYRDTFKLNPTADLKEVGNARLQDSVTITILLDGTPKGRTITIKPNETFERYFINGTLAQSEGWVNPGKEFSKLFVEAIDSLMGYFVEIKFDYRKEKFYGFLAFNKVYKACAGDPSARSYFIRIPPVYVYNALGGNISVVYEYYECAPRIDNKAVRDYTTKKSRYTSWVLWLSDISFVED